MTNQKPQQDWESRFDEEFPEKVATLHRGVSGCVELSIIIDRDKARAFLEKELHLIATKSREQGLKDSLVLAYDLADTNGLLDYGKLHRKVEKTLSKKEQL